VYLQVSVHNIFGTLSNGVSVKRRQDGSKHSGAYQNDLLQPPGGKQRTL